MSRLERKIGAKSIRNGKSFGLIISSNIIHISLEKSGFSTKKALYANRALISSISKTSLIIVRYAFSVSSPFPEDKTRGDNAQTGKVGDCLCIARAFETIQSTTSNHPCLFCYFPSPSYRNLHRQRFCPTATAVYFSETILYFFLNKNFDPGGITRGPEYWALHFARDSCMLPPLTNR